MCMCMLPIYSSSIEAQTCAHPAGYGPSSQSRAVGSRRSALAHLQLRPLSQAGVSCLISVHVCAEPSGDRLCAQDFLTKSRAHAGLGLTIWMPSMETLARATCGDMA